MVATGSHLSAERRSLSDWTAVFLGLSSLILTQGCSCCSASLVTQLYPSFRKVPKRRSLFTSGCQTEKRLDRPPVST